MHAGTDAGINYEAVQFRCAGWVPMMGTKAPRERACCGRVPCVHQKERRRGGGNSRVHACTDAALVWLQDSARGAQCRHFMSACPHTCMHAYNHAAPARLHEAGRAEHKEEFIHASSVIQGISKHVCVHACARACACVCVCVQLRHGHRNIKDFLGCTALEPGGAMRNVLVVAPLFGTSSSCMATLN
eukprot:351251-Chlamydomonas_euryale.AAC.5